MSLCAVLNTQATIRTSIIPTRSEINNHKTESYIFGGRGGYLIFIAPDLAPKALFLLATLSESPMSLVPIRLLSARQFASLRTWRALEFQLVVYPRV